jgi:hypothetical protein
VKKALHARRDSIVVVAALLVAQAGGAMFPCRAQQDADGPGRKSLIDVVIWTDKTVYSRADSVEVFVLLRNTANAIVYVDRRMFWGGLAGGLDIVITDEHGKAVPPPFAGDALMPPPKDKNMSTLIRLDRDSFYGTSLVFPVEGWIDRAGRYSIRVVYLSHLRPEYFPPEIGKLPVVWADAGVIESAPRWIEVR